MKNQYPLLEVHLDKIYENAQHIVSLCRDHDIHVSGVIKGCNASKEVLQVLEDAGCHAIASSRMKQLIDIKRYHPNTELMMLRLPMQCELEDLVKYVNISLNSDQTTLYEINEVCMRLHKKHQVILMYDLGDLREGVWSDDDFIKLALYVERLSHVELMGVGSNLGCYGSIRPSHHNLTHLVELAEKIESKINRTLTFISGGATSTIPLVVSGEIPKRINHLRIGEAILLGRDLKDYFDCPIEALNTDTFIFKTQIIEVQNKPSYPMGEIYVNAFGNTPNYEDHGIRTRAILAAGKQDFGDHTKLISLNKDIEIIGSSSDHLIVDITDHVSKLAVGDILSFEMCYQSMLYLTMGSLNIDYIKA